MGRKGMKPWGVALGIVAAGLILATPAVAQTRPKATDAAGWRGLADQLTREIDNDNCHKAIEDGRGLGFSYFTDQQVEECDHVAIEAILERNRKYIVNLECQAKIEERNAAEFRAKGAEGLEDAVLDVVDPIPDGITDLLRKVSTAMDVGSVLGNAIVLYDAGLTATEFDQLATRLRRFSGEYLEVLLGQRERYDARRLAGTRFEKSKCPPDDLPPPKRVPVVTEESPKPSRPPQAPAPPRHLVTAGRNIFRCDMDITDPTLGRLVFCTEYDSQRIGQQPTQEHVDMSAKICHEAGGTWQPGACAEGWKTSCMTKKGVGHFYYQFIEGAPESQCKRWKGKLTKS